MEIKTPTVANRPTNQRAQKKFRATDNEDKKKQRNEVNRKQNGE